MTLTMQQPKGKFNWQLAFVRQQMHCHCSSNNNMNNNYNITNTATTATSAITKSHYNTSSSNNRLTFIINALALMFALSLMAQQNAFVAAAITVPTSSSTSVTSATSTSAANGLDAAAAAASTLASASSTSSAATSANADSIGSSTNYEHNFAYVPHYYGKQQHASTAAYALHDPHTRAYYNGPHQQQHQQLQHIGSAIAATANGFVPSTLTAAGQHYMAATTAAASLHKGALVTFNHVAMPTPLPPVSPYANTYEPESDGDGDVGVGGGGGGGAGDDDVFDSLRNYADEADGGHAAATAANYAAGALERGNVYDLTAQQQLERQQHRHYNGATLPTAVSYQRTYTTPVRMRAVGNAATNGQRDNDRDDDDGDEDGGGVDAYPSYGRDYDLSRYRNQQQLLQQHDVDDVQATAMPQQQHNTDFLQQFYKGFTLQHYDGDQRSNRHNAHTSDADDGAGGGAGESDVNSTADVDNDGIDDGGDGVGDKRNHQRLSSSIHVKHHHHQQPHHRQQHQQQQQHQYDSLPHALPHFQNRYDGQHIAAGRRRVRQHNITFDSVKSPTENYVTPAHHATLHDGSRDNALLLRTLQQQLHEQQYQFNELQHQHQQQQQQHQQHLLHGVHHPLPQLDAFGALGGAHVAVAALPPPAPHAAVTLPQISTTVHHTPLSAAAVAGIPLQRHVHVTRHIPLPTHYRQIHVLHNQSVPIPIPQPVINTVPRPLPIHVPVPKTVAVPQLQDVKIPVERIRPFPVERAIPYIVERRVPYRVEKQVATPIYYPYPIKVPIIKTVVHKVHRPSTHNTPHQSYFQLG